MRAPLHLFLIPISITLAAGCGGNSSGGDTGLDIVPGDPPATIDSDNSYGNFKLIGLTSQNLPAAGDARSYGQFAGDESTDVFIATLRYSPSSSSPETAQPSRFAIFEGNPDGSYSATSELLDTEDGCIHPRRALTADFNTDGRQDIFVVCHGYDAPPFPGEQNKVILSQADGTFRVSNASDMAGFHHGGTAADLNGDGYPDVLIANNMDPNAPYALINQQDGTFSREEGIRLPRELWGRQYFSIEMLDANGDDMLDLAVGGHEWEGAPTRLYLNPGNNVFEGVSPYEIPAVENQGVVLDFVATGSTAEPVLWVLRTSGGGDSFYASRTLQRVNLNDLSSTVVVEDEPAAWVRWVIPVLAADQISIVGDSTADAFEYSD